MSIESKLKMEIEGELDALNGMEKGSEPYKVTVDGVTKLMDRAIELDKIDIEKQEKLSALDRETEFKLQQMREERTTKIIGHCLTGAGIVIPALLTIWGTVKSIEFEKEGTITTIMGRGFIQKLLPRK